MEEWKDIPGHPGYQASNQGQIRSIDRAIYSKRWNGIRVLKGQLLRPFDNGKGYSAVSIGQPRRRAFVHVLVLETFQGPRPNGADACHRDGNKQNNSSQNLYWGTRKENVQDAIRHGTFLAPPRFRGESHSNAKLMATDVLAIRRDREAGRPLDQVATKFGISRSTVSAIMHGRLWKWL